MPMFSRYPKLCSMQASLMSPRIGVREAASFIIVAVSGSLSAASSFKVSSAIFRKRSEKSISSSFSNLSGGTLSIDGFSGEKYIFYEYICCKFGVFAVSTYPDLAPSTSP